MFRRPKVQFKPKIQSDRKIAVPAKAADQNLVPAEKSCEPALTPAPQKPALPEPSYEIEQISLESESVAQCEFENGIPANDALNCLNESFDSTDSLVTHEVLIDASVVFAVPQPAVRPITAVAETRRPVTLKAKETAAALTVTPAPGEQSAHSDSRDKKQPRKPRICLSSNRIRLPVDKSKVTMFDLLSYNPPLSDEQRERRRKADEEAELLSQRSSSGSPSKVSASRSSVSSGSPVKDDKSKGTSTGPRVKIGANGEIVIDEESLILSKKIDTVTDTVHEGSEQADSQVTYASFRNKTAFSCKKSRWTDEETVKFYKALSAVGTDFSLMSKVFFKGSRNRLDLRNKYKKEEKMNQHLIDKALDNTDLSLLDDMDLQHVGSDEDENQKDPNQQQALSAPDAIATSAAVAADPNNNNTAPKANTRSKRSSPRPSVEQDEAYVPQKVSRGSELMASRESDELTVPRRSLRRKK